MRFIRTVAALSFLVLVVSCGSGNKSSPSTAGQKGPLAGNWQFTLTPTASHVGLQMTGFLLQAKDAISGSLQNPGYGGQAKCAGQSPVSGALNGTNVTISINESASTLALTGAASSDMKSLSGTYTDLGGGCFSKPTTGSWTATEIPPMTGDFTGYFNSTEYLPLLNMPVMVPVTGSFTQSPNIGASSASVTGTIMAQGYPCLVQASVSGTISGPNVYLSVYGANQALIGTLGRPISNGAAIFSVNSSGVPQLRGSASHGTNGLSLGTQSLTGAQIGPCPALPVAGSVPQEDDTADVCFAFSPNAQCGP